MAGIKTFLDLNHKGEKKTDEFINVIKIESLMFVLSTLSL